MMHIEKIIKKLPKGFLDECETWDEARLKADIIQSEKNIEVVETAKADDEKLTQAKEMVKEMTAPYSDAVKAQRAKIAYVMYRLAELGKAPIGDVEGFDE